MRNYVTFIIIFLSYCLSGSAGADPITDIYQVEVIVFEHKDPKRFQAENWSKFVGKLDLKRAVNLDRLQSNIPESLDTMEVLNALDDAGEKPAAKITEESVNLVDQKHFLLNKELKIIKSSRNDRFIKHIAWNQPLANNVKSTPVYFTGGKDQEVAALLSIKPNRNVFNVDINLIYKIQADDRSDGALVDEIKMVRSVKVKKKEVYYVDHPVIGMIIIISPVLYGTTSYAPLP